MCEESFEIVEVVYLMILEKYLSVHLIFILT